VNVPAPRAGREGIDWIFTSCPAAGKIDESCSALTSPEPLPTLDEKGKTDHGHITRSK
jgi:hypothetical protein